MNTARRADPTIVIWRVVVVFLTAVTLILGGLVAGLTSASAEPSVGQQLTPAPLPREKRILENVHTDAVSVYLDDGKLNLQTKADIDVNGDGVTDLSTRLATHETLFHVDAAAQTQVPDMAAFSFLGQPGDPIWMAPQTQDATLIWPGFSTEDPNLRGKTGDNPVKIRMLDVTGPGNVELFLQNGTTPQRVFSSQEKMPDWSLDVPQHVHMNWVFTVPGTYHLTFEAEATVDGNKQSASNVYTFVVGDMDVHRQDTRTAIKVVSEPDAQTPLFHASVTPEASEEQVEGAVQFVDRGNGSVLGHTPLVDGGAEFSAEYLAPGPHDIVAEFVPTWANDFQYSSSEPISVTIPGEQEPAPTEDDAVAPTPAELDSLTARDGVKVTTLRNPAAPLDDVILSLTSTEYFGRWVSVWFVSDTNYWIGWRQVDFAGRLSVQIGEDIALGRYRVAMKNTDGKVLGWDNLEVAQPQVPGPDPNPDPGPGPGQNPSPDPNPSQSPGPDPHPRPNPSANPTPNPGPSFHSNPGGQPTNGATSPGNCQPGIVLDYGHIDTFFVSEAGGTAVMQLNEDVTGSHVKRAPETVLLKVKESANQPVASGLPGAPQGYLLPLTQDQSLIWPGWDTNNTKSGGYSNVGINVTNVDGPGTVYIYSQGSFGDLNPVLDGGRTSLPGVIRQASPAHTHAQWVFSEKGIYTLTAHAVLTNPSTGASISTSSHTYVFQVGDVPLGNVFCSVAPTEADQAAAQQVNSAVAQRTQVQLANDQAHAGQNTQTGVMPLSADQAAAKAATTAKNGVVPHAGQKGTGKALTRAAVEQALAALPLSVWLVVAGGIVVVLAVSVYTAYKLGRNKRVVPGSSST